MKRAQLNTQIMKASDGSNSLGSNVKGKTYVVEVGSTLSDLKLVCFRGTTRYLRSCESVSSKSEWLTQSDEGRRLFLSHVENVLKTLSQSGELRSTVFYLGHRSDPFIPFNGKFDMMQSFLRLFKRYMPGRLFIKTRSPVVVCVLPDLQALGPRVSIVVPIETDVDELAKKYTPNFPRPTERFKMARVLSNFGIEVVARVSPVLPYGSWKRDAKRFAQNLISHVDYIQIFPLSDGSINSEKRLRKTELVQKLSADSKYQWLRPDAAEPLIKSIEMLAPQKLQEPLMAYKDGEQIGLFAA